MTRGPVRDMRRELEMRALYLQGQTLAAIGVRFGVTRERVRQILARIGISRTDGGLAARVARTRSDRERATVARLDARAQKKYGCTRAELIACNEGKKLTDKSSFALKFWTQKHNADWRGIEWQLSLPEWKRIWIESGHWHERGRGVGYVMSRRGDVGPYAAWNVYITPSPQNIKDGYANRRLREAA